MDIKDMLQKVEEAVNDGSIKNRMPVEFPQTDNELYDLWDEFNDYVASQGRTARDYTTAENIVRSHIEFLIKANMGVYGEELTYEQTIGSVPKR